MIITVFLADDHAVMRDGLRLLLQAQPDIQVVGEAANGRDAVSGVAKLGPEIAVLDIAMPELDGIEATRRIREACPATQVVVLSMHSTPAHVFRALQAGARGYLLKESAGAEVVNAIRAVHTGHRYLSREISDQVIEEYVRWRETSGGDDPLARLSPREYQVLRFVVDGKTSAEIAEILSLSPKTVEGYRSRIMEKLDVHDIPGLVKFAIQRGVIPLS